jgi:hypothetical protein
VGLTVAMAARVARLVLAVKPVRVVLRVRALVWAVRLAVRAWVAKAAQGAMASRAASWSSPTPARLQVVLVAWRALKVLSSTANPVQLANRTQHRALTEKLPRMALTVTAAKVALVA